MRILIQSLRNLYVKYQETGKGLVTDEKINQMYQDGTITQKEKVFILTGEK